MDNELKERIRNNSFVDNVRNQMLIDEGQYDELCRLLEELAYTWSDAQVVDKELALVLYSMPQMIRNIFLSFKKHEKPMPEVAVRLEDIWVELDALVIKCLS